MNARLISLFGYETDGGSDSVLWHDPERIQEWIDQGGEELAERLVHFSKKKRRFFFEEIVHGIWVKVGDHGYHRQVGFFEDGTLSEMPLFSFNQDDAWDGTWELIDGVLRLNIGWYELDVFASHTGLHSGVEDYQDQRHTYYKVLHAMPEFYGDKTPPGFDPDELALAGEEE
jgi:hypothetical protein